MKEYPPLYNVELTPRTIAKLKSHFSWSAFSEGETITSVTPSGGIHYSGMRTKTKCVIFEIKRGGIYVMVSLFAYPKGVILHTHIFYQDIGKKDLKPIVQNIYNEVKNLLEE